MTPTTQPHEIPADIKAMAEKIAAYAARLKMTPRLTPQSILLIDGKGRTAARIDAAGIVTREYAGREALLGTVGAAELRNLLADVAQAQAITRAAAETMALRARECQCTAAVLFATAHTVYFDMPGHTDAERVEHAVGVTPELIERAEAILNSWNGSR